ncbi:hypothetical protein BH20BAC1_BH20BAC1_00390 [soil metagenome]
MKFFYYQRENVDKLEIMFKNHTLENNGSI